MSADPPAPAVSDQVLPVVSRLLTCANDLLEHYQVPVCRAFWTPGASAPWDACGRTVGGAEGQLWVGVESRFPTDNFPTPSAGAHRCTPAEFGVNLQVGVLRCAHTVDDQGNAPPAEAISDDAMKVSRDATILEQAILCCFIDEDSDPGTFRLGSWEPLGPNGGCVGGRWRLAARVARCRCPDLTEAAVVDGTELSILPA